MTAQKHFNLKYQICLYKAYFDKGLAITSYIKWIIAFFGMASQDVKLTLIVGFCYAIFCFFLGLYWFKSSFIIAEAEVGNRYNLFMREVRRKI